MTPMQAIRLAVLRSLSDLPPGYARHITPIANQVGFSYDITRAILRDLKAEGLTEYQKGLWSEDGTPMGAGYGITDQGRKWLDEMDWQGAWA